MLKKRKKITFLLYIAQIVPALSYSCDNGCTCSTRIVTCIKAGLSKVPDNIDENIRELDLSYNQIESTSATANNIMPLSELESLNLSHNKLTKIDYDMFDDMDNLDELDLSYNEIHAMDDDTFEWNPLELRILRINNNNLKFVEHFTFYDLEKLEELYLQDNIIKIIHSLAFSNMKKLQVLDLSNNHLISFAEDWVKEPLRLDPGMHVKFQNNPWTCDCGMIDAFKYFKSSAFKSSRSSLDNQIVCNDDEFKNQKLLDLSISDLSGACKDPVIKQLSKSTTVQAGKTIKLQCIAEGKPPPKVTWIAPNEDVYRLDSDGFEGIDVDEDGALLIEKVNSKDAGKYTCTATSTATSKQQQAFMTLTVEGDDPEEEEESDYDPLEESDDGWTNEIDNTVAMDANFDSSKIINSATYCPKQCNCNGDEIDCSYVSGGVKMKDFPTLPEDDGARNLHLRLDLKFQELMKIPSKVCSEIRTSHLEFLELEGNLIDSIKRDAFVGCDRLMNINLKNNQVHREDLVAFSNMKNLEGLVLDGNGIESIAAKTFVNNPRLKFIFLRNNRLTYVDSNAIIGSPEFMTLHLSDNKLPDVHVELIKNLQRMSQRSQVHYQHNEIDCNSCNIKGLLTSDKSLDGQGLDYSRITCHLPKHFRDQSIEEIANELPAKCTNPSPQMPYKQSSGWLVTFFKFLMLAGIIYAGYFLYQKWLLKKSIEPRFMNESYGQGDMVPQQHGYHQQQNFDFNSGSTQNLTGPGSNQEAYA